jgi:hypothetical protein
MKTSNLRLAIIAAGLLGSATLTHAALLVQWDFNDAGSANTSANAGTLGSTFDLRTFESNSNISTTQTNIQSTLTPGGAGKSLNLTSTGSMGGAQGAFGNIAAASTSVSNLSAMTVSGWFNASAAPTNGVTLLRASSGGNNGWQITFIGGQQMRLLVGDGSAATNYNSNATAFAGAANTWQFFSVSWTALGGATWYVGSPSSSATAAGSNATARTMNSNSFQVSLGRSGTGAGNAFYGYLDDIRIYDTALDATAIESVRASSIPEPATFAAILGLGVLGVVATRRRRA